MNEQNYEQIDFPEEALDILEKAGYAEPTRTQADAYDELLGTENMVLIGNAMSGKTSVAAVAWAVASKNSEKLNNAIILCQSSDKTYEQLSELELSGDDSGISVIEFGSLSSANLENAPDWIIIDSPADDQLADTVSFVEKAQQQNSSVRIVLLATEASDAIDSKLGELFKGSVQIGGQLKSAVLQCEHFYCDVGTDLLAKPTALCDLVEFEKEPKTIVYCNLPSDVDLVEAMLRRRGVKVVKLIGNVPAHKVKRTLEKLESGGLSTVVLTDIAAEQVDPGLFELAINYSIHNESDVYKKRTSPAAGRSKLKKAINLVGPVDLGNFHFVKSAIDTEIQSIALPSAADIAERRYSKLRETAIADKASETGDQNTNLELAAKIIEDEEKVKIVSWLLTQAQENQARKGSARSDDRRDDRRGGRDRDGRGRGRYNRGRNDDRSIEELAAATQRKPRTPQAPPKKDARFYVGHGLNDGFSEEELTALIEKAGQDGIKGKLKRLSVRDSYAWADFPEEVAESVNESLSGATRENGDELFIKRAALITCPREETEDNDKAEGPAAAEQPAEAQAAEA